MTESAPLTVWTNVALSAEEAAWLEQALAPHVLVRSRQDGESNLVAGAPDPHCAAADIAFGQPAVEDVLKSETLQWIHLTSAGYTRYDRVDVSASLRDRGAALTNSSGVYDEPCAQHVLAFMLGQGRHLVQAADFCRQGEWGYPMLRPKMRVLRGDRVLLVGFGAIARRLVELLSPFSVEVRGIRRTVTGSEPVPCLGVDQLHEQLAWADHVVNILPANESTFKVFGPEAFLKMKEGAVFYNIGRGDTVDQDSLVDALELRRLAAAYLDVTSPEPLPADHRLWRTLNCFITPHVAGGLKEESQALLDHFCSNFGRFSSGQVLVDRIY